MKGPIMKISKLATAVLVLSVGLCLSGCGTKDDDVDVEDNFQSLKMLTALEAADYDNFGMSVAIDGEFALVGSPGDDTEGIERRRRLSLRQDRGRDRRLGRGDQARRGRRGRRRPVRDRGRHRRELRRRRGPQRGRRRDRPGRGLHLPQGPGRRQRLGPGRPPQGERRGERGRFRLLRSPSTGPPSSSAPRASPATPPRKARPTSSSRTRAGWTTGARRPSSSPTTPATPTSTATPSPSRAISPSSASPERTGPGRIAARSASTRAISAARTPGGW